jgi:hypothetical protein
MSSKNGLVPGPVNTVNDPVFEVLAETMSEVLFQAVYEMLALFSSKFSKVIFATVAFVIPAGAITPPVVILFDKPLVILPII